MSFNEANGHKSAQDSPALAQALRERLRGLAIKLDDDRHGDDLLVGEPPANEAAENGPTNEPKSISELAHSRMLAAAAKLGRKQTGPPPAKEMADANAAMEADDSALDEIPAMPEAVRGRLRQLAEKLEKDRQKLEEARRTAKAEADGLRAALEEARQENTTLREKHQQFLRSLETRQEGFMQAALDDFESLLEQKLAHKTSTEAGHGR